MPGNLQAPESKAGAHDCQLIAMNVKILNKEILSANWYKLYKYTYALIDENGHEQVQSREAYDRGNGATILLYNSKRHTVILTEQFRLPTLVNGNATGMLIETCAGLLDLDNPEECIRRETEEETGYRIDEDERIEVLELDFERACEMVTAGEIRDAKTVILLQYARLHSLLAGG